MSKQDDISIVFYVFDFLISIWRVRAQIADTKILYLISNSFFPLLKRIFLSDSHLQKRYDMAISQSRENRNVGLKETIVYRFNQQS